jgi:phosphoglycerate kinase
MTGANLKDGDAMTWKTLDDMELGGRIVLTRVDINVPMEGGRVTDATRIERIVPTVKDILAKGGKPVLWPISGGPRAGCAGDVAPPLVPALEAALGQPVTFVDPPTARRWRHFPRAAVILLENTRFSPMETENDPKMAQFLAALGDIYCNDAFSAAHRAHASTEGVARLLPLRGPADGRRNWRAGEAALGQSGAPGAGRGGRRQGLDQARPPGQPDPRRSTCW